MLSQKERIASIATPLGPDALLLRRMSGREAISQLFHFDLELCRERSQANVDFKQIVGSNVTVSLGRQNRATRYFNGIISRFSQSGRDQNLVYYSAEMVPNLWLLTRSADCRIFQEKSVPDILSEVFSDFGLSDFSLQLGQVEHPKRTYCVQYRETAFDFVSRLMEEEGIGYCFRHSNGKHTLTLFDSNSVLEPCPENEKVVFRAAEAVSGRGGEVYDWTYEREMSPGVHSLKDYNFEAPSDKLDAKTPPVEPIGGSARHERFDYPGRYSEGASGNRLSKLRIEAAECAGYDISAMSDCPGFSAGFRFALEGHYRADRNGPYVLTEVAHSLSEGVGHDEELGSTYQNHFACIPLSVPFRPLQTSERPIIPGIQTAVVTGPKGEKDQSGVYTDKYGRVKVQFHWDRRGKRDEKSSCWIRVSQLWAGQGWGGVTLPRIGQEVIVEFLEGDPDQPLITGRVYNANQVVPYALPKHRTVSTWQSRSTNKATRQQYNEIRFEDSQGDEELYIQAEKDQVIFVKNDQDTLVKNDQRATIHGSRDLLVKGARHQTIEAVDQLHVKSSRSQKIDGTQSLEVGKDQHEKVGGNHALDAGQKIHIKGGMTVVIEAGLQLSLKVGGSFVDIGPAGVSISGPLVNINSGGAAASGSGASPEAPEDAKEVEEPEPI